MDSINDEEEYAKVYKVTIVPSIDDKYGRYEFTPKITITNGLKTGKLYKFDVSDPSNVGYHISLLEMTNSYTPEIERYGLPGIKNSYITIRIEHESYYNFYEKDRAFIPGFKYNPIFVKSSKSKIKQEKSSYQTSIDLENMKINTSL